MTGTNAGVWETAYVTDTRPKGRLLLNRTLTNTYAVDASSKVQVVRVPHYRNVRIGNNEVLTVSPWDGASGGVMFLRVQNDLDVRNGGKIDVSGAGFRGGRVSETRNPCGPTYCPLRSSCYASSECSNGTCWTVYDCRAGSSSPSLSASEGSHGRGGEAGGDGRDGWKGGSYIISTSGSGGTGDGGAGGSAGGGGGGGSLAASGTRGDNGGGGYGGGKVFTSCVVNSAPESSFAEPGLEWIKIRERNADTCNAGDGNCEMYYNPNDGTYLGAKKYGDTASCANYSYRNDYSGGYPNILRPGGAGGQAGPLVGVPSNRILLGTGGGVGGFGGMGGSGGGGGGGAVGAPGRGNDGGTGSGAIIIFAKDISISGAILANGANGYLGATGGLGRPGEVSGTTNAYRGGGGGGGAGGGGGGGGSGGVILLYGENVALGNNNNVLSLGGAGGGGGGGAGGGSGYRLSEGDTGGGGGGSGGNGSQGGNGSTGAIFVAYTNSLSGTTNPVANTQVGSVVPYSGIIPTPTPTLTPTPTPTPTPDPAFNNLVAYWKMNEASGTTVADSIGSNNGTANGTTVVADGKIGRARNFDGFDDSIGVPDNSSLEGMSRLTVSVWIKPSTVAGLGYIITKAIIGAIPESKDSPYNIVRRSSAVDVTIGNGSTSRGITGRTSLSTGRFYHLVMTYDGTTLKLYVNGTEDGSIPANIGALTANAVGLSMGKSDSAFYGAGIYPFGGIMDEVGIWNRALTREEISRLYNGGNGVSP
ncbi:LamG domain-containing protein [Candidatus Daviesbacteria bacterium]|nr:LamG domain-containing protein [Candidatus Daviesbacteria bacterium]